MAAWEICTEVAVSSQLSAVRKKAPLGRAGLFLVEAARGILVDGHRTSVVGKSKVANVNSFNLWRGDQSRRLQHVAASFVGVNFVKSRHLLLSCYFGGGNLNNGNAVLGILLANGADQFSQWRIGVEI